MPKDKPKNTAKTRKIVVKNEESPTPAGIKEYRENIFMTLVARYHIAKQSRKFH